MAHGDLWGRQPGSRRTSQWEARYGRQESDAKREEETEEGEDGEGLTT
jgi:hypothetical protein